MSSLTKKQSVPLRKVFACELPTLRFNGEKDYYELKIDGKTFDARFVWLQGYLSRDQVDARTESSPISHANGSTDDHWLFMDRTFSGIPIVLPDVVERVYEERYYSILAVPCSSGVTVSDGEKLGNSLKLKAKKVVDLNLGMSEEEAKKHNEMIEEMWSYEVVQYHRMICQ